MTLGNPWKDTLMCLTLEEYPTLDTLMNPCQTTDNFSYQKMSLIHQDHPHKDADYPIHMALSCKIFPKITSANRFQLLLILIALNWKRKNKDFIYLRYYVNLKSMIRYVDISMLHHFNAWMQFKNCHYERLKFAYMS